MRHCRILCELLSPSMAIMTLFQSGNRMTMELLTLKLEASRRPTIVVMMPCRQTLKRHRLFQLSMAREARSMDQSRALLWLFRMILPLCHRFLANEIEYWTVVMQIAQEMRQRNLQIWCNRKQPITSVRQRSRRHWDETLDQIHLKQVVPRSLTIKKVVVKVNLRLPLEELWTIAKHTIRLPQRKSSNKLRWVFNSLMTSFSKKNRRSMTFTSNTRKWNRSKMENVPNLRPESPKSNHNRSSMKSISSSSTGVNAAKLSKKQAKAR